MKSLEPFKDLINPEAFMVDSSNTTISNGKGNALQPTKPYILSLITRQITHNGLPWDASNSGTSETKITEVTFAFQLSNSEFISGEIMMHLQIVIHTMKDQC